MYFRNDVRQPPGRTRGRGHFEASVSLPPAHRLPVSFCNRRHTSAAAEAADSTQTYACATPQTVRATPHITPCYYQKPAGRAKTGCITVVAIR